MTTEFSGTGDPRRTIELMWGAPGRPRRGPKPKITAEMIVQAAVAVADAEGLAALSMRRVADELDVAAMSLYTYVPGKAELLDAMLDRVLGELPAPDPAGGWRAGLESLAREQWTLYHRHPWLLQISTSRPPIGPNISAKYERELAVVEGVGLDDVEMDAVLTLVNGYVQGTVRGSVEAMEAQRRTGITDLQWWQAYAPLLAEVMNPADYPISGRVGATVGQLFNAPASPSFAFGFGLARLLDGVGLLIAARTAPTA